MEAYTQSGRPQETFERNWLKSPPMSVSSRSWRASSAPSLFPSMAKCGEVPREEDKSGLGSGPDPCSPDNPPCPGDP
ncbi:hypothetical protein E2C01_063427 [Portunus trituberculatus]|uniref:Uncharacterized protein n=1 Tax=Portunus trituberculatus TaxID=210409 RepID=A0A5B7H944_PORTR|nr:hypothetical protein [Portunus trituberculatus]